MRIVFMGTPDFAADILKYIATWEKAEIVGVYSQPDRVAHRGHKLTPPPVKLAANELELSVYQPLNFKNIEDVEALKALNPDVLVVAAYGLILPQSVLDIPKYGAFNVHASLLPFYRGAAPIQRAIMEEKKVTGITIMKMDIGLDTGDMVLQKALAIGINDTSSILFKELAGLGSKLMLDSLKILDEQGYIDAMPQDNERATYAKKLEKIDGYINFDQTANQVHARIRAVDMNPKATTMAHITGLEPISMILSAGSVGDKLAEDVKPGTILGLKDGALCVACSDYEYLLYRVKPSGKKEMNASDFFNGYSMKKLAPNYGYLQIDSQKQ